MPHIVPYFMSQRQTEQAKVKPARKPKRYRTQNYSPEITPRKRGLPQGAYARFIAAQLQTV